MALIVRGVKKAYNHQPALCGVDLDLQSGIVALLGPNGSGKTTLLRILATILSPEQGEINWRGYHYSGKLRLIRHQLGYLPQDLQLPEHLTPLRLMNYLAQLKGGAEDSQIPNLLDELNLLPLAERPFGQLSPGQRRLVGVAQAFLGHPNLLLLDELTLGLDVREREAVFRLVRRHLEDRLVIFSTHIPSDVERLARVMIILKEGQVLYQGDVESFRTQVNGMVYELRTGIGEKTSIPGSSCVCRVKEDEHGSILRLVGELPAGCPAVPVSATLEDAYLYMLRK
ncbi:MAG: ATP-binding cassette domain-containing protein [Anaerolineales bacterium]